MRDWMYSFREKTNRNLRQARRLDVNENLLPYNLDPDSALASTSMIEIRKIYPAEFS